GEPTATQLALMAAIVREIRQTVTIPIGVNVQFNAWEAEIGIAYACGAQFVRVEVFVETLVAAQGIVPPCSAQITRLRKALGADGVALWADVQTKYTTPLVPQSIVQAARDAQSAGADALIVTGAGNGQATPLEAVAQVKAAVSLPVIVGSGTNAANVSQVLQAADGAIVGSSLKEGGSVYNAVSAQASDDFMRAARQTKR
ncbi:MAG: tryptophan synthase subunit alpha, partial [Burkholderiales bacterium]|nr:tryptophan synthase subunit alpha [Anaerolineae bacterium]